MINKLHIKNYRCFRDFSLDECQSITLIGGENCVGKTALLEAIWLCFGSHNPHLTINVERRRNIVSLTTETLLENLFADFDISRTIEITSFRDEDTQETLRIQQVPAEKEEVEPSGGVGDQDSNGFETEVRHDDTTESNTMKLQMTTYDAAGKERFSGHISPTPKGKLSVEQGKPYRHPTAIWVTPDANPESLTDRYTKIVDRGYKDKLVDTLRIIDERVTDVQVLKRAETHYIHVQAKGFDRWVPIGLMGSGLAKVCTMAVNMPKAEDGGALLIDEFENGLHYSIQADVWRAIHDLACDFDVQIFATTHSYECIMAAVEGLSGRAQNRFCYYRLDPGPAGKGPVAKHFSFDDLQTASEMNMELRG